MRWQRRLILAATALVVAAAPPLASIAPEELEFNRRYIERDPRRHEQLVESLLRFNQLPVDQQLRIRQLDRDLREETSGTQARLLQAAQRYAEWLEHLPPEQQRRIQEAPDKEKRLQVIKELRQQQWVERLPKGQRERVLSASAADRPALIERYRADERRRQQEWQVASRHWDDLTTKGIPDRLEKLPPAVQEFVKDTLLPRITQDDRDRLRKAEGRWPEYPRTLVEVTERNTFRLLHAVAGPNKLEDLPEELQKRLRNVKFPELTKKKKIYLHMTWVDFAEEVTKIAKKNNVPLPQPLGPCFPKDFAKPIRDFIVQKLMNFNSGVLDRTERERLKQAEGYWPLYPYTMLELARKHHLPIPGTVLPGSADFWEKYRDSAGEEPSVVSDRVLHEFAMAELTEEEREGLRLSPSEPAARDRLQQEYIRRHPDEWHKLQQSDQQKRQRKK